MSKKTRRQRRMIIEPLEPRLLFSATTDALLVDDFGDEAAYMADAALSTDLVQVYALQDDAPGADESAEDDSPPLDADTSTQTRQTVENIIFIDTAVEDYQALLDDILANKDGDTVKIFLLDANTNGIDQISETLAGYSGVTAVHLISHGNTGSVQLGNTLLTSATVEHHTDAISSWGAALTEDADLLIYGCNVGGNEAGRDLLGQLADLTQADIAASDDLTGHQSLSGDWELEYKHGAIETDVAVSEATQYSWNYLLADTNYIHVDIGNQQVEVSSSNHIGQSFLVDNAGATYTVNEISLQLARYASTPLQSVTVELRDAWNGTVLGTATISSDVISDTGFEWHTFSFADVQLNQSQEYVIRISTNDPGGSGNGVLVGYHDSNKWNNAYMLENGTANPSGWDLAFKVSQDDGVNQTPTVSTAIPDQTADEDVLFNYILPGNTFSDADTNDTLTYRAQRAGGGSLDWLEFNEITRTFSGTPHNDDVGTMDVEVTATDNHGASTSEIFTITINNSNDDPFVRFPIADQPATEGSAFSYTVWPDAFGDDDAGDTLTYSAQLSGGGALPSWLTFDPGTRTFSGTPTSGDIGTISVEVTADDGNGGTSATDAFDIVVYTAPSDANQVHVSSGASVDDTGVTIDQLAAQTFTNSAGTGTYNVDSIAVQLRYNVGATNQTPQTVTVSLLNDFNGTVLGSNTMSSADLTTSLAWYSFNFSTVSLTYGQQYFIKIEASGGSGDPLVFAGIHNSDVYANGTYIYNSGTADASRDMVFEISYGNNSPTVANAIPDQVAPEEAAFVYTIPAGAFNDLDGDTLTYTATLADGTGLPPWLNFNAATRELWGTPDDGNVGTVSVRITADDGNGGTVSDVFNLTVTNVNDAPHVEFSVPDQTAADNTPFSYTFPANTFGDADLDSLTYTAQLAGGGSLPGWLNFDSATRTFSGTPATSDVGTISVEVTASDGNGGTITDTFDLIVNDTNDAPVITSDGGGTIALVNAAENQTAVTTVTNTDADAGDTHTFSISGGTDAGLFSIDSGTGILTINSARDYENFTDANSDGIYEVEVTASDGNLTDTQLIRVAITNVNEAPAGTNNTVTTNEDTAYTFALADFGFTDSDGGDSLDGVRIDTLPSAGSLILSGVDVTVGQLVSATDITDGSLVFTPAANVNGADYASFTFSVRDVGGLYDATPNTLTVDVAAVNDAPVITSDSGGATTAVSVAENQTAITTVTATDVDGDTPAFSISGGADATLFSINATTGELTFVNAPDSENATDADTDGVYEVQVTASDGSGGTDVQAISVTVTNVNEGPTVTNAITNQSATEDVAFSFQFASNTFADVDGDTLAYTAQLADDGSLPGWLSFDAATRTFSGTPTNGDVGTVSIDVIANDGNGGTVTETFDIVVANSNDAPTVANTIADQNATEDVGFNFQFASNTFNDVDGDALTYSAQLAGGGTLPPWLSFDTAARTFSGTPTNADVGIVSVDVIASDGNGATAVETFDIVVTGNSAPTSNGVANITNIEDANGDSVDLFAAFDDLEDTDAQLQYAVIGNSNAALISGATVDPASGRLQLEYGADQYGTGIITLQATDREGASVTSRFTVDITPVNDTPTTVGAEPAGLIMDSSTTASRLNFLGAFFDIEDGSNMTYAVVDNSNPAIAQVVAVDSEVGTFIVSHNGSLDGTTTVTIRATDSDGAWVERSLRVQVQKAADEPQPTPTNPTPQPDTEGEQDEPVSDNGGEKPPAAENPDTGQEPAPAPMPPDASAPPLTPSLDPLLENLGPAPAPFDFADFDYEPVQNDRRYEPPQDHDEKVEQQMRELTAVPQTNLISLTASPGGYLNEQDLSDFEAAIDRARETMSEAYEEEQRRQDAIAAVTVSFTTGLIIWSLRASSLLLTLFSMLPLWKGIDPLPVLEDVKKRRKQLEQQRRDKSQEDSNSREVGYLFDQPKTPRHK